jgi:hypothetical protein
MVQKTPLVSIRYWTTTIVVIIIIIIIIINIMALQPFVGAGIAQSV